MAWPSKSATSVPIPTHLTLGQPTVNIDALNPSFSQHGSGCARMHRLRIPFYGVCCVSPGALCPAPTIPAFRLLLPYPAYTAINEIFGDNNYANYNSMVVKVHEAIQSRPHLPEHIYMVEEYG